MSTTSPSAPAQSTRDTIQQLLPTCERCRRLRRKCDTQLPNCRLCDRAGAECTFYDHALEQALPRAYVQSLLTRVDHLEAVKNGISSSPHAAATTTQPPQNTIREALAEDLPTHNSPASPSFDVVIPSTTTAGKSCFWGSSSVFAVIVEVLQHAASRGFISVEDSEDGSDFGGEHDDDQASHSQTAAPDSDIQALVRLYLVSLNAIYGFVDQVETTVDLQIYLALRQSPGFSPQALHGEQAHHFFRITMMCAISCANQARYRPQRTAECLAYYADAVACVEEVTSEASPASLQALLLLIVFCLFYPRKGDIWKLLDYACRLTIELGYHTEAEYDQAVGTEAETEAQGKLRRSTFWGLYAIERIVGQLFGRGSDLPETIITTEYPNSLHPGISPNVSPITFPGVDRATVQSMSIAHHYRLVYLRSEIFRSMYLPASPPELGLDWLKDKHTTLYMWRRELAVGDDLEGVATITCDVGYDATMCFLFQPLLLKALRSTAASVEFNGQDQDQSQGHETSPGPNDNTLIVASDPFYSAIYLIRTYEKIVRAPERSVLGTYPITFLSAHYIYLASSTLLAHALLRLDGRTNMLKRMSDSDVVSESNTEDVDWGAFVDISSSCLILLAWCGERWPGMMGMLGVYQKLFGRITRELIVKGIVR
ncbi:hypothetical protein QQX98_007848 [Neonectria punicea]|uniref:Zn(2)-C6 fungal-type domain-containing protein n=1 Tax=Neonectria punicea TaxID=979145 RepID=A0ABR1GWR0_9HYPO